MMMMKNTLAEKIVDLPGYVLIMVPWARWFDGNNCSKIGSMLHIVLFKSVIDNKDGGIRHVGCFNQVLTKCSPISVVLQKDQVEIWGLDEDENKLIRIEERMKLIMS